MSDNDQVIHLCIVGRCQADVQEGVLCQRHRAMVSDDVGKVLDDAASFWEFVRAREEALRCIAEQEKVR